MKRIILTIALLAIGISLFGGREERGGRGGGHGGRGGGRGRDMGHGGEHGRGGEHKFFADQPQGWGGWDRGRREDWWRKNHRGQPFPAQFEGLYKP